MLQPQLAQYAFFAMRLDDRMLMTVHLHQCRGQMRQAPELAVAVEELGKEIGLVR